MSFLIEMANKRGGMRAINHSGTCCYRNLEVVTVTPPSSHHPGLDYFPLSARYWVFYSLLIQTPCYEGLCCDVVIKLYSYYNIIIVIFTLLTQTLEGSKVFPNQQANGFNHGVNFSVDIFSSAPRCKRGAALLHVRETWVELALGEEGNLSIVS